MSENQTQPKLRILRIRELLQRTSLSRQYIEELMRAGRFPLPVAIGTRHRGWIEHEVEAWIAARIAEREQKPSSTPPGMGAQVDQKTVQKPGAKGAL